jgi:prepilin signal peptidase PulO-like enzyme (type II secretory pathway)
MFPLPIRLAFIFVVGALLGSFANWAIYALAWTPRTISPWSRLEAGAAPRRRFDRVPIFGWFALSREAAVHGAGHWVRPMLLEIGFGAALCALYWWEVVRLELIVPQVGQAFVAPAGHIHMQFLAHAILFGLMLAASFIDIDEKTIPDHITVTGTLIGLILMTLAPMALLPHVAERAARTSVSEPIIGPQGMQLLAPNGDPLWLEPVTVEAPRPWPSGPAIVNGWPGLTIAIACYWLWCVALARRVWRGSRGVFFALSLIAIRVGRELNQFPLRPILGFGTAGIVAVWYLYERAWVGLFTALVGLVASGGIVWAVRLIGTAALRREAMGFGDVTLMMMIGTFIGWQAGLIAFFVAPFAGLFVGIAQFVLRRDDEIPYGPFLCQATVAVIVAWAPIWEWAQPMFGMGGLVPSVLFVCLGMLGVMLLIWRIIKTTIFGWSTEEEE